MRFNLLLLQHVELLLNIIKRIVLYIVGIIVMAYCGIELKFRPKIVDLFKLLVLQHGFTKFPINIIDVILIELRTFVQFLILCNADLSDLLQFQNKLIIGGSQSTHDLLELLLVLNICQSLN